MKSDRNTQGKCMKMTGGIKRNKTEKVHFELMIMNHNENKYHILVFLVFFMEQ